MNAICVNVMVYNVSIKSINMYREMSRDFRVAKEREKYKGYL